MTGVKGRSGPRFKPATEHRIYRGVRLAPDTDAALQAMRQGPRDSLGKVIDRVVAQQTRGETDMEQAQIPSAAAREAMSDMTRLARAAGAHWIHGSQVAPGGIEAAFGETGFYQFRRWLEQQHPTASVSTSTEGNITIVTVSLQGLE